MCLQLILHAWELLIVNFFCSVVFCHIFSKMPSSDPLRKVPKCSLSLCLSLVKDSLVVFFFFFPAAQLCPTLFYPMDCSPPGSSVRGILQARILEWVALPFSRGSSAPRNETWSPALQGTLLSEPLGKPHTTHLRIVKMVNLCCVGFATFLKMLSTDPLRKIPKFFFFSFLSPTLFQLLKVVLHSNSWILLPNKNAL